VDTVRKQEHRRLQHAGGSPLTGTKYQWLRHPAHFTTAAWRACGRLRAQVTAVARAWALKEAARQLWDCRTPAQADRHFRAWYHWTRCSRLEPLRQAAALLKRHWSNVRTYFVHRLTNAGGEGMNAVIQMLQ
jgi:transposase